MSGEDRREKPQGNEALRHRVEELTFDIGRILHANTSTLLMVNQTLEAVAQALAPELVGSDGFTSEEQAGALVRERASELAGALEQLLSAGREEQRREALPEAAWSMLSEQVPMLLDYEKRIPVPELRVSALRTIAAQVGASVRSIPPGRMPRERTRAVLRAAGDLERLTCFCEVRNTRRGVIQMDATLRALRDFVTSDIRTHEVRDRLGVTSLVREATAQLREFAQASGVDLVWRDRDEELEVVGSERELVRAIANLLHNAIKYSWRREAGRAPWVGIATVEEDEMVAIGIENWGVPVSVDEIKQELVFELGYRGKWSTDRGRLGTGIGLTDARRAARAHGGDVTVESRPARLSSPRPGHPDYYRQPFLTKVTLRLPRAG